MSKSDTKTLIQLEGSEISVTLRDGGRIDRATLVSSGRGHTATAWLYDGTDDHFVQVADIEAVDPVVRADAA